MIGISKREVAELGNLALKLENIYDFSPGTITLSSLLDLSNSDYLDGSIQNHVSAYIDDPKREDDSQIGVLNQIDRKTRAYAHYLGRIELDNIPQTPEIFARLISHHFTDDLNSINMWIGLLKAQKNYTSPFFKGPAARYLITIHHVRSYLTAIAYLASGDKKYLSSIPHQDLICLFNITTSKNINHNDIGEFPDANNLIYLALLQPVYNMRNSDIHFNASIIQDYLKPGDKYIRYEVTDYSTGVLGKDGTPMKQKDLFQLFLRYSTKKNGGLGLDTLRHISNWLGGFVEVVTKTEDNAPIAYSTIKGKINTPDYFSPQIKHGTTFSLYVPIRK